jgi:hypothetical protein
MTEQHPATEQVVSEAERIANGASDDTPGHAVRKPDGTWHLHLATTTDMTGREARERELRSIVHMAARELRDLGGENCSEQIAYRVGHWASEAVAG